MTPMEYDPESLRALAGKLESDDLKIENSFFLSDEHYYATADDFILGMDYIGADEESMRDKDSSTLEFSRAFFKACQTGNDILIGMDKLRFAIANSIDQMNYNQAQTEGKNTDEIGTLYKALD
jgi:hypothetical protein